MSRAVLGRVRALLPVAGGASAGAAREGVVTAGRNRVLALSGLAALWLLLDLWSSGPAQRDLAVTVVTSQLGYAHFAGSLFAARARIKQVARAGDSVLGWLMAGSTLLTLFALYSWLAQSQVWLLGLLVLSLWHIVENDVALGAAYRARLRMPPMARCPREQLVPAGWTLVALWWLLAALSPGEQLATSVGRPPPALWWSLQGGLLAVALLVAISARRDRAGAPRALGHAGAFSLLAFFSPRDVSAWISFEALYALISLYHYASWFVLLSDRASTGVGRGAQRGQFARLVRWHVVWCAVAGAVIAWPPTCELALRLGLLSPALFLFWATVHVVQSHWLRGIARLPARGATP